MADGLQGEEDLVLTMIEKEIDFFPQEQAPHEVVVCQENLAQEVAEEEEGEVIRWTMATLEEQEEVADFFGVAVEEMEEGALIH